MIHTMLKLTSAKTKQTHATKQNDHQAVREITEPLLFLTGLCRLVQITYQNPQRYHLT